MYGDKSLADKFRLYFLDGAVFGMDGTSSWSSSREIAEFYSNKHQGKKYEYEKEITEKIILVKKKTKVNGTSIRYLSHSPDEHEILTSEKARFRIYERKVDDDGTIVYYLEEL